MGRHHKRTRSVGDIAACDEDIVRMEQEALSMTDNQSRKRRRNKAKPGDKLEARRQSMTGVDLLGSDIPSAKRRKMQIPELNGSSEGPSQPQMNGSKHLNGTPTTKSDTSVRTKRTKESAKKKNKKSNASSTMQPQLNGYSPPQENGLSTSSKSNDSSSAFIELEQLSASTPKITLIETHQIEEETTVTSSEQGIVTTPSDEENEDEDQAYETEDGGDDSTITNGIDIDESTGDPNEDDGAELDSDLADFIVDEAEDDDDEDEEDEEDEEIIVHRRTKRQEPLKLPSAVKKSLRAATAQHAPTAVAQFPGFFGDLLVDQLDSEDDEDYEIDPEDYEDDAEEANEYDAATHVRTVDESELHDLLHDAEQNDEVSMEDEMDESDVERYTYLDPDGSQPKPVSLSVADYVVDADPPTFVNMSRMGAAEYAPERYELFCFSQQDEHSVNSAAKLMKWLIEPLGVQSFFEQIYTKRALAIHRLDPDYYSNIFSSESFYALFQDNFLRYGENVNIANYKEGVRTSHNLEGRVYAGAVRAFLERGMSVQCVNPQSYDKNLHYICEVLSELFNCFVGANCYYTPKKSAGFAPHYDDIDAFIIQCEGRKKWTIYAPDEDEQWPMQSSDNFTPEQIEEMSERRVYDGWLEQGDILYLPRGYIHSAKASKKQHSLHVTISVAQNFSYGHLLESITKLMLDANADEIPRLRSNLPINLLDVCGVADSLYDNEDQFLKTLERPIDLFLSQLAVGVNEAIPAAVDELAKKFMRKALPPLLTPYEKALSIHCADDEEPQVPEMHAGTEVRLIRKHAQRLLFDSEGSAFLIHRMANSMQYEGYPEVIVDVPTELVTGVELLMQHYPEWDEINELGSDLAENLAVATLLYENGLLLIRNA